MVISTLGVILLFSVLKQTNRHGRVVISEVVDLVENRQSYGAVGNPVGKEWAARCPFLTNRLSIAECRLSTNPQPHPEALTLLPWQPHTA